MKKTSHKIRPDKPVDPNQRYDLSEAIPYLRLAKSTVWKKINCGELQIIRDSGRVFVPGSEIVRLSTLPSPTPASVDISAPH
jgi:hypothetical protein